MNEQAGDDVQLVVFRVGGQEFAVNIFQVERILRHQPPTALPQAPDFLEGMIPYGEGHVPLVDLRKRLGVPAPVRDETRVMIIEWEHGKVGVIVDAVREVRRVAAQRIAPPPSIVQGLAAEYINGVIGLDDRTIVILAAPRLLTSTEKLALDALTVKAADV